MSEFLFSISTSNSENISVGFTIRSASYGDDFMKISVLARDEWDKLADVKSISELASTIISIINWDTSYGYAIDYSSPKHSFTTKKKDKALQTLESDCELLFLGTENIGSITIHCEFYGDHKDRYDVCFGDTELEKNYLDVMEKIDNLVYDVSSVDEHRVYEELRGSGFFSRFNDDSISVLAGYLCNNQCGLGTSSNFLYTENFVVFPCNRQVCTDLSLEQGDVKISASFTSDVKSKPPKFSKKVTRKGKTEQPINITLPDGITEVTKSSLDKNIRKKVATVIIPESAIEISALAFSGCTKLERIFLPQGLKTIGASAFNSCVSLTEITLPSGILEIQWEAFSGCELLREVIIPDSVEKFSTPYLFYHCKSLESIVLPRCTSEISECTFEGCSSLKHIIIPDAVKSIGSCVFQGCSSLESFTIPVGVKKIWDCAFKDCSKLKHLVILNPKIKIPASALEGVAPDIIIEATSLNQLPKKYQPNVRLFDSRE